MAKGTPSEVIMVGGAADTRPRVQETAEAPPRPKKEKAQIFEPGKGGYAFSGDGGFTESPAPAPPMKPVSEPAPPPAVSQPAAAEPPVEPKVKAAPKPEPTPKPKSKPKPKKPKKISAQEQGKVMAQAVVGSVIERMKAEATQRGGYISVADMEAMEAEFAETAANLGKSFEESFDAYADARERAAWDQKRDFPYDRLIVKKFSHLFKETDVTRADRVSRRILPGFFLAQGMMLGPDAVEEYQEKCRLLVGRISDQHGEDFDWEDVYEAPDAKALILDALVNMVGQFTDYERRSTWFIELINSHLSPLDGADRTDAGWELSPAGARRLFQTLFKDLAQVISTDAGKMRITGRHGGDVAAQATRLLKKIGYKL